jgi:hypothetical protein
VPEQHINGIEQRNIFKVVLIMVFSANQEILRNGKGMLSNLLVISEDLSSAVKTSDSRFPAKIYQNTPPFKAGPVEFPSGSPIQQGRDEWHPLPGVWGSLFKPATICPVVLGRPFDRPFDRLTVLSKVEGHQSATSLWRQPHSARWRQ